MFGSMGCERPLKNQLYSAVSLLKTDSEWEDAWIGRDKNLASAILAPLFNPDQL